MWDGIQGNGWDTVVGQVVSMKKHFSPGCGSFSECPVN